ncbi:MAG: ATP-binding cassette domain-containing protein, partial [Anaerolineales bacterium]
MLTAHQLSKSYNTKNVLTDVSFNINAGERVGLIGPNGSGKTTLLRILIDQEYADTGHISLTPSNLKIGYLSQGFEPSSKDTIRSLIQKESKTPEALELELIRVSTALTKQPDNIELQIAYDHILSRMQQPSAIGHLYSILTTLGLDHLPDDQFVSTL